MTTTALGAPISVMVVVLALKRVRTPSDRFERLARWGWLSIAASSVLFSIGEGLWAGHAQFGLQGSTADTAHGIWLAVNPLAVVGAGLILAGRRRANLEFALDSAASAAASGLVAWAFTDQSNEAASSVSVAARVAAAGYPSLGSVSIFAIVVLMGLAVRLRRERLPLMLAAAAIALSMLASVLFVTDVLNHQVAWVPWYQAGFFGARALTLVAVSMAVRVSGEDENEVRGPLAGIVQMTVPWAVAATVALTADGGRLSEQALKDPPVLLGSFALVSLLLARQALALREHRLLSEALHRARETLEADVERRTEQLALRNGQMESLHQLLVAINDSLDEAGVLHAAHRHAGEAFRADVYAAWHLPVGANDRLEMVHLSGLPDADPWARHLRRLRAVPGTLRRMVAQRRGNDRELHVRFVRLVSQHQCFGLIGVARWSHPFSPSDEALLESMGRAVGGALHNARRFAAARDAADRDPMTGLLNHRAIHERLQALLSQAIQTGSGGAVLMIDVNDFKHFNDAYGHQTGDQVILQVARILQETCPAGASLGRYGGDEFFVAVPGVDRRGAKALVEAIRERTARQPLVVDGSPLATVISLAVGIATYPDDSQKPLELLAHADSKLYQSKFQRQADAGRRRIAPQTEPSSAFLDAMIDAIDAKDHYTRAHSEAVAEYASWLSEGLDLPEDQLAALRMAALLHDIGKIGVPDDILCKPGILEPQEFETMRRHPVTGALIVTAVPGLAPLARAIRSHHERWDGRGYPDSLSGEAICHEGRILAIADAFAAMTMDRPYRRAKTWEEALSEIEAGAGQQFDPSLTGVFAAAVRLRMRATRAA